MPCALEYSRETRIGDEADSEATLVERRATNRVKSKLVPEPADRNQIRVRSAFRQRILFSMRAKYYALAQRNTTP